MNLLLYIIVWAVFHGNKFSGEMPLSVCDNSDKVSPPGKITLLTADCFDDGPVVCSCCNYCGGETQQREREGKRVCVRERER